MPPYEPLLHWAGDKVLQIKLNLGNFAFLVEDDLYWKAYLNSIKVASVSTFFCLLLGYPMAYAIARSNPSARNILMLLIVLPFWTSFLLRVYAWIGILKNNGLLNNFLICDRRDRPADPDAADGLRRLRRHRLFVPAVHDPAAVRQPREDGPDACSRRRPTSAAGPGRDS